MSVIPLIIKSNSCMGIYEENNPINFSNNFPESIRLYDDSDQSDYQIALQSIIVDANFSNVPNDIARLNSHFQIYNGNTYDENLSPLSSFKIDNQLYTLDNLIFELDSKISMSSLIEDGGVNVKITNVKDFLKIEVKYCTLLIHVNVCDWLGIIKSEVLTTSGEYAIYEHETSIVSGKNLLGNALIPKLIKVKLSQITTFNFFDHKDLAILATSEIASNGLIYYIATTKEYFRLNTIRLEELTVELTDENNFPLLLVKGQPTIIQLIVKKMNNKSFIVRINSEESKNTFSDNVRENFRTQIWHLTDLTYEKWQVALTSIHFPNSIDISCTLAKEEFWIEFISIGEIPVNKKITFEDDNIYDILSLKECINRKVKIAIGDSKFVFSIFDGKARIQFYNPMVVRLSPLFSYVIGRDITNLNQLNIKAARELTFPKKIDLQRCKPNVIFLHCDFISPLIVGDKYMRVLKMIPFSHGKYECKHLDFINVMSNNLSSIQIQLMDASG